MARYERGGYSVEVADNGEIRVKPGDWLSKYSYAMFGNYTTLNDYVRPDPVSPSGWKPITNKDLVRAGEILLYKPTYENWKKQKRAPEPAPLPAPAPADPADVDSSQWMAAWLGALDGTEIVVSGGVLLLAFWNGTNGKTFFYVVPRIGGGAGYDLGHVVEEVKLLFKAIGTVLFFQKAATATFVPFQVAYPFSANDIDRQTVDCIGWDFSTGAPGQNWSYEKLTVRDHAYVYGEVVFKGSNRWEFPGGSVHLTGGVLVRVW